jgi:hypothetical protein
MPAYLIKKRHTITRKSGDSSEIVFTIPATHPMQPGVLLRFGIADGNRIFLLKNIEAMTVDGQQVRVPLDKIDLKGRSGRSDWELEYTGITGLATTLGNGDFNILKELL